MTILEFNYSGNITTIKGERNEKIEEIFNKFSVKSGENLNNLLFLYSGKAILEKNINLNSIMNQIDKKRNKMNILVIDKSKDEDLDYNNYYKFSTEPSTTYIESTQAFSADNNYVNEAQYRSNDNNLNSINEIPYLTNNNSNNITYSTSDIYTNTNNIEPISTNITNRDTPSIETIQNSMTEPIITTVSPIQEIPVTTSPNTNLYELNSNIITTPISTEVPFSTPVTTTSFNPIQVSNIVPAEPLITYSATSIPQIPIAATNQFNSAPVSVTSTKAQNNLNMNQIAYPFNTINNIPEAIPITPIPSIPSIPVVIPVLTSTFPDKKELPIPGCNCPKCTNLRNEINSNINSLPVFTTEPMNPQIINSTPIPMANAIPIQNFIEANEKPIPGCNCPKCTNLRNNSNTIINGPTSNAFGMATSIPSPIPIQSNINAISPKINVTENPLPGCNCPRCSELRRKINSNNNPIPIINLNQQSISGPFTINNSRPIQPVQAIPVSTPVITSGFAQPKEAPIPGCNCPKCTNLRNKINSNINPLPVYETTRIPTILMQSSTISNERPNPPIIAQRIQNPILTKTEIPIPGCNCLKCTKMPYFPPFGRQWFRFGCAAGPPAGQARGRPRAAGPYPGC